MHSDFGVIGMKRGSQSIKSKGVICSANIKTHLAVLTGSQAHATAPFEKF